MEALTATVSSTSIVGVAAKYDKVASFCELYEVQQQVDHLDLHQVVGARAARALRAWVADRGGTGHFV